MSESQSPDPERSTPAPLDSERAPVAPPRPREIGGRKSGLDPTRFGDWEKDGRCVDF
ncbi:MAG TPA: DUF1674 domain-containing protein [Rhodanobacteraceae bacterium]